MSSLGKVGGPYIRKDVLTARGDIIERDVNNPARVGLGVLGNMLFCNNNDAAWYSPCTNVGDIPIHTAVGYQQALVAAAAGKFLRANGAGVMPSYEDLPAGFAANCGYITYNSNGTKYLAHGLGTPPKLVIIYAVAAAGDQLPSWGIGKVGSNQCLYGVLTARDFDMHTSRILRVRHSAGTIPTGYITAADNANISLVMENTDGSTIKIIWAAVR